MADIDDVSNGATLPQGSAQNHLVIDSALADWIYHRADDDQAIGLGEIESGAKVLEYSQSFKANAARLGLVVSNDGFIYNYQTGFAAAIVQDSLGYAVVYRGTDFGEGSFGDITSAVASAGATAPQNTDPTQNKLDVYDLQSDFELGLGLAEPSNQIRDARNVLNLLLQENDISESNVRLVGQSLGGGLAGVVAAVSGVKATVIDPAPFELELKTQALIDAFEDVTSESWWDHNLLLDNTLTGANPPETAADYIIETDGRDAYETFNDLYESNLQLYQDQLTGITAYRVRGEFISRWGQMIDDPLSQYFPIPIKEFDVGQVDDTSLLQYVSALAEHSPSLAALIIRTSLDPAAPGDFATLLRQDTVLRDAFLGDNTGNTGALSHARSDLPQGQIYPTSAVNGTSPDPNILLRALWKTVGENKGLYDYFFTVFNDRLRNGSAQDVGDGKLHAGLEELVLAVMRDAVQDSSTVDDVEKTDGSPEANFLQSAGGVGDGAPLADKVVIHRSDITATDTHQKEANGLDFGVNDLDHAIEDRLNAATGSQASVDLLLGRSYDQVFGVPAQTVPLVDGEETIPGITAQGLDWNVVVAFTSGDGTTYFDPSDKATGAREGDDTKKLLIFGGSGQSVITGGSDDDFIFAGDGNSTIIGGGGNDTIVGGAGNDSITGGADADYLNGGGGNDTIVAGNGRETIDGGSGVDTLTFARTAPAVGQNDGDHDANQGVTLTLKASSGERGASVLLGPFWNLSGANYPSDDFQNIEKVQLTDQKDTLVVDIDPTAAMPTGLVIDAGSQPDGTGDVLDLSKESVKQTSYHTLANSTVVPIDGIDFEKNRIKGIEGVSFQNFEILNGTSSSDYVVGDDDLKNINLGDGNDVVGDLSGGVLPGQESLDNNRWVYVDLGAGADTVTGGLSAGSQVNLGLADGATDKVLNVMNDVRINQAGAEDKFYILDGMVQLHGGYRNTMSESAWAHDANGVRYAIDSNGELAINFAGATMYVSNFNNSLSQPTATGGLLVFDYSVRSYMLLDPNKPAHDSNSDWELFYGYMWKANYGYSAWKGVDPLVLDLNGQGIVTTSVPTAGDDGSAYGTRFDMKGNGFTTYTGWISENDAFVVRDLNGNGRIDDIHEMVGQGTSSGFMSLASYDYNGDGKVDAADWTDLNGNGVRDEGEGALDVLRIWRDANGNAVTDPGELMTFAEAGIQSISVGSTKLNGVFNNGNQILDSGSFVRTDGSTGAASDVTFSVDDYHSTWTPDNVPVISTTIQSLPELKGHGDLTNLRDAMALDEAAADAQQAAVSAATGAPAPRRETLADLIARLGPTMDTPNLEAIRSAAEPILEAWARTAPLAKTSSTPDTSVDGSNPVLNFVIHHAGGPDEPIDYAYQVHDEATSADGTASTVTYWKLGSGATVTDRDGQTIDRPSLQDLLTFSPATGGVWQSTDGLGRDLAPLSPQNSIQLFMSSNGDTSKIVDYAYLVDDGTGTGHWALASGAPITDATGQPIAAPTYDNVLAYTPSAGGQPVSGRWTSPLDDDLAYQVGDPQRALTMLVKPNADGTVHVVDYAKAITTTSVVNGVPVTQTYYALASGAPVLDATGTTIEKPNYEQLLAYLPQTGEVWQSVYAPTPETSSDVPHQGLTMLVQTEADGTQRIVDYAFSVTETVADPASTSGFRQATYWRLESGNIVRDPAGHAIAQPTFEQVMASATPVGASWQHVSGSTIDFTVAPHAPTEMLLLTRTASDGTEQAVDVASLTTKTVMVTGAEGLVAQQESVWTLASGDMITDAQGALVSSPTLQQVEAYAAQQGDHTQLLQGATLQITPPSAHAGVTVLIQHTDGQADTIADYAYEVTAPVATSDDGGQTFTTHDVSYWKLGSGSVVRDAQGLGILYPTLDQVLAYGQAAGRQWEHFSGAYVQFLEDYMGDKAAIDLPGVIEKEGFSDFVSAFNLMLQKIDEVSVRLAVQTGLKPFFEDVVYNPDTDNFAPTTDRQLVPTFEAILSATAGMSGAEETSYLASWKAVLDVVIADYSRGTGGNNNYGFLFSNIAAAYQDVGAQTSLGIIATAEALGIPHGLVVDAPGTMPGTDDPDIFYMDNGDQTARGGGGLDNYVMGDHFGHDVVDDVELTGQQTFYDDVLRFTTYNSDDLNVVREGTDLVLSVKERDDQTVRLVDEFHGVMPGYLFLADLTDDHGVENIVFADGTVWDREDMARAAQHVTPVDGVVQGTPADDVLNGGPGADYEMRGGNGSDTYIWGRGYGNDTVFDDATYVLDLGVNTIEFNADVSASDLTFKSDLNDNNLIIGVKGYDKTLTIKEEFAGFNSVLFGNIFENQIIALTFDNGRDDPISVKQIEADLLQSTDGNDVIYGFVLQDDTLYGGLGDDQLFGKDGNDTYLYNLGDGHDTITEAQLGGDDDELHLGAGITSGSTTVERNGSDLTLSFVDGGSIKLVGEDLPAGGGVETIVFGDGTAWTKQDLENAFVSEEEASGTTTLTGFDENNDVLIGTSGDDTLSGLNGNDTLAGGFGNDLLDGGDGDDTYLYNLGDGNDTIASQELQGYGDRLVLGAGLTPQNTNLSYDGRDMTLSFADGGSVDLMYENSAGGGIQLVVFGDGTTWTRDQLEAAYIAQQEAAGATQIIGFDRRDDLIVGSAGDDSLYGLGGNDTLVGGAGNDRLDGGDGDDTYLYNLGDGNDTIASQELQGYGDRLVLGAGLTPQNTNLSYDGRDMTLSFADGGSVDLMYENSAGGGIQLVAFGDGTTWTRDQLEGAYIAQQEAAGATQIIGFDRRDDSIVGSAGDDSLYGLGGNDTLVGGAGNDRLDGGDGDDTYLYNLGDGNDTIASQELQGYGDRLVLGNGLDANAVSVDRVGDDYTLAFSDGGSVRLAGEALQTGAGVQTIVFGDGTTWTKADLQAAYVLQQAANGYSWDGTESQTIAAGDVTDGLLVTPTLTAERIQLSRSGNDLTITDLTTNQYLVIASEFGGAGGVVSLLFADGSSINRSEIDSQAWYRAGAGDVTVQSQNGDGATLAAGVGNDTLVAGDRGNAGSTTFVYEKADGNMEAVAHVYGDLTISNTLKLLDLDASDVTLSRSGSDLQVTINETGKVITVDGEFNSTAHDGVQQIAFADGTVLSRDGIQTDAWYRAGVGDVTVQSQNGNGTLAAGVGNDTLVAGDRGNAGSTTFVYEKADGNMEAVAHVYGGITISNTLKLLDLDASGVTLSRSGSDLQVAVADTGKVITVDGEFNSTTHDGVQQIAFADGTVLSRDGIQAEAWYRAGAGDVTVQSQNGDGATLAAGVGNDTLVAGDRGNAGSTTFVYEKADGNMEAVAHVYGDLTISNTLKLLDLDASDVTLSRSGSDLQVTINETGKVITVDGEFNSTTHDGVQQIAFADGTLFDRTRLDAVFYADPSNPYTPSPGSDNASVSVGDNGGLNYVNGTAAISFAANADSNVAVDYDNYGSKSTLDVFKYASEDGNVWIRDTSGTNDVLEFMNIDSTDVTVKRAYGRNGNDSVGVDLVVSVGSTGKQITLDNFNLTDLPVGPQTFIFADGVAWSKSQILGMLTDATPAAAQIRFDNAFSYKNLATPYGSPTAADVYFDSGSDTIETSAGSDTFHYTATDGNAVIVDHQAQTDALKFEDLNATDVTFSRGPSPNDLIISVNATGKSIEVQNQFASNGPNGIGAIAFGDGETLDATAIRSAAWYRAGDAPTADLTAQEDGATMEAGAGSDVLHDAFDGGTFVYKSMSGDLSIDAHSSASHFDSLDLADFNASDVTFSQNGGDLLIGVNATSHTITVGGEFNSADKDGVQQIAFADGTKWDHAQIVTAAQHA